MDFKFLHLSFGTHEIAYVIGEWPTDDSNLDRLKYKFNSYEKNKFKLTTGCLKYIFSIQFKLVINIPYYLLKMDKHVIYADLKGVKSLIEKKIEIENINYAAEINRSDYNPNHILKTLILNQHDRKSIGIGHGATIQTCPQLRFVYFDRYFTLCPIYNKTFGKLWDKKFIVNTGRHTLDRYHSYKRDDIKHRKICGSKHIITVFIPTISKVKDNHLRNLFVALVQVIYVYKDFKIIIKTRNGKEISKLNKMFDDFFFVYARHLINGLTTLEAIDYASVVISCSCSWTINESLALGKYVFTIPYMGYEYQVYGSYGNDFILGNPSMIFDAMIASDTMNVNWDQLERDHDFRHDGKNEHFTTREIWNALQEKSSKL